MAYLNKVFLMGNIGKDPEIRVTQNGQKQAKFSLATTERYKDKATGEQRENTQWHNIVAWRTVADQIERLSLKKGISLYVEGAIKNRSWDDPSGQKKYSTDIEIERFQILTAREKTQTQVPSQDEYDQSGADDMPF